MATQSPPKNASLKEKLRGFPRFRLNAAYVFIFPYTLFLLAFGVGPGFYALVISFAKFEIGIPQYFQAGFSNYVIAYTDFRFLQSATNVGKFVLYSVPVGIILVVVLALLLHARPGKLSSGVRTIYFLPGAVAGPTAVLLAIFMFDPNISPFRPMLQAMGYEIVSDTIRAGNFPLIFTILGVFTGAGGWIAIFYGALNTISVEVTEAAILDGCSMWQMARYIKLPLIKPYVIYMTILVFAGNVQLFAQPQLIGAAGVTPITRYWSLNQLGYALAFESANFGASAALSLLLVGIGLTGAILILSLTDVFQTE